MKYTKLVRDKIPEILDSKGVSYEKRVVSGDEYHLALVDKLIEEVREFKIDHSSEELADVLEVIDALLKLPDYTDVGTLQKEKREERGGFMGGIIITGEKDDSYKGSRT